MGVVGEFAPIFMSYRAAQLSAVECISQTAIEPFARCVCAKPFLGKCYFSFKKVCANIPPKPPLAVSEIHSTRLRWLRPPPTLRVGMTKKMMRKHIKQPLRGFNLPRKSKFAQALRPRQYPFFKRFWGFQGALLSKGPLARQIKIYRLTMAQNTPRFPPLPRGDSKEAR